MKKLRLISIAVFVALAAAALSWYAKEARELAETPGEEPSGILDFFFPARSGEPASAERGERPRGEEGAPVPRLREVSREPVAGAGFASSTAGLVIRFLDRVGELKETPVESFETSRLSSALIPQVSEAVFSPDGERVLIRYLAEDAETLKTFAAALAGATSAQARLAGSFLEDGVRAIAYGGDGRILYVRETANGAAVTAATAEGERRATLATLPVAEWHVAPFGGAFVLTTRPSAAVRGYAYSFDARTGALGKLLASGFGLSALPNPAGGRILFGDGSLSLFVLFGKERVALPVATLPEKCAWAGAATLYCAVPETLPAGEPYPDAWYRGEISFADGLWKIDAANGVGEYVADLSALAGKQLDASGLAVSSDGAYLLFTNRADGGLWRFRLAD